MLIAPAGSRAVSPPAGGTFVAEQKYPKISLEPAVLRIPLVRRFCEDIVFMGLALAKLGDTCSGYEHGLVLKPGAGLPAGPLKGSAVPKTSAHEHT